MTDPSQPHTNWYASQQPGYGQAPYGYPVAGARPENGMGITGMVLGIVGLTLFWIPVLNFILGILATIFGGVGLSKAKSGTATNGGMAIAGLVLGILTIIIPLVMYLLLAATGARTR